MSNLSVSRSIWISILVAMILAVGVRSIRINAPFTQVREWEAAFYANEIRNWHRFGLKATYFFPSCTMGKVSSERLEYHVTHWPLPLYFVYAAHKVMGINAENMSEWSVRIVPIIFGVLTIPVLFVLVRQLGISLIMSGMCVAFAALSFGHAYFTQTMACNLSTTLFFMLLAFWRYLCWADDASIKNTALFVLFYTMALYCLWEAYYLFPAIILFHWLNRKPKLTRLAILLTISTLIIAALYMWHVSLLPNADTLVGRFATRSSAEIILNTPIHYFEKIAYRYLFYHSIPLAVASLFWLVNVFSNFREARRHPAQVFAIATLILGLVDVFLMPHGYMNHDYFILGFFFFSVVSSALGIDLWLRRKNRLPWRDPVTVVFLFAFLIQTTFCMYWRYIHHYHTNDKPVVYELSRSVGKHTHYGEEVLTDLNRNEQAYNPFYADSLILFEIGSAADISNAKERFADRHFRYFVTTSQPLAEEGIDLFRTLKSKGEDSKKARAQYNVRPENDPFHQYLARHYRKVIYPPFIYYDLDSPLRP